MNWQLFCSSLSVLIGSRILDSIQWDISAFIFSIPPSDDKLDWSNDKNTKHIRQGSFAELSIRQSLCSTYSASHKSMHMVQALLYDVVIWYESCIPITFRIASLALGQSFDCPSAGETIMKWYGAIIAPVLMKQSWMIWVNTFCVPAETDNSSQTKQKDKIKPCTYLMGYNFNTVALLIWYWCIGEKERLC